jgi:hypothetical protein
METIKIRRKSKEVDIKDLSKSELEQKINFFKENYEKYNSALQKINQEEKRIGFKWY